MVVAECLCGPIYVYIEEVIVQMIVYRGRGHWVLMSNTPPFLIGGVRKKLMIFFPILSPKYFFPALMILTYLPRPKTFLCDAGRYG